MGNRVEKSASKVLALSGGIALGAAGVGGSGMLLSENSIQPPEIEKTSVPTPCLESAETFQGSSHRSDLGYQNIDLRLSTLPYRSSESGLDWAQHFAAQGTDRAMLSQQSQSDRAQLAFARASQLEASFSSQITETTRRPGPGGDLAGLLADLGTGAQLAGARSVEGAQQTERETRQAITEKLKSIIEATAVTSEERIQAMQMVTSLCTGVPTSGVSGGGGGSRQSSQSSGGPISSPPGSSQQQPTERTISASPRPASVQGGGSSLQPQAPREPVVVKQSSEPQMIQAGLPAISRVLKPIVTGIAGWFAAKTDDKITSENPGLQELKCKASAEAGRLIDGLACPNPSLPGNAGNFMPQDPERLQEWLECNERAGFIRREALEQCADQAQESRKLLEEREERYRQSRQDRSDR